MAHVQLATSGDIALPAPKPGVGYSGGFGLELNDTDPTITAGQSSAPVSFDTAYTLEDDNLDIQTPINTSYMVYDGGTSLQIVQAGWYQAAWEISFNRAIDNDGVIYISVIGQQKQDNSWIPLTGVSYNGDSRLIYFSAGASLGMSMASSLAADIDLTYASIIVTPLFPLAE